MNIHSRVNSIFHLYFHYRRCIGRQILTKLWPQTCFLNVWHTHVSYFSEPLAYKTIWLIKINTYNILWGLDNSKHNETDSYILWGLDNSTQNETDSYILWGLDNSTHNETDSYTLWGLNISTHNKTNVLYYDKKNQYETRFFMKLLKTEITTTQNFVHNTHQPRWTPITYVMVTKLNVQKG